MSETKKIRVRILIEQRAHRGLNRPYLASGEEVAIDKEWAIELLDRGDAQPVAEKPSKRAETRERKAPQESR